MTHQKTGTNLAASIAPPTGRLTRQRLRRALAAGGACALAKPVDNPEKIGKGRSTKTHVNNVETNSQSVNPHATTKDAERPRQALSQLTLNFSMDDVNSRENTKACFDRPSRKCISEISAPCGENTSSLSSSLESGLGPQAASVEDLDNDGLESKQAIDQTEMKFEYRSKPKTMDDLNVESAARAEMPLIDDFIHLTQSSESKSPPLTTPSVSSDPLCLPKSPALVESLSSQKISKACLVENESISNRVDGTSPQDKRIRYRPSPRNTSQILNTLTINETGPVSESLGINDKKKSSTSRASELAHVRDQLNGKSKNDGGKLLTEDAPRCDQNVTHVTHTADQNVTKKPCNVAKLNRSTPSELDQDMMADLCGVPTSALLLRDQSCQAEFVHSTTRQRIALNFSTAMISTTQRRCLLVGCNKEADIRIDQGGISRRHAVVYYSTSNDLVVKDLGGKLGTVVNEVKITNEMTLRAGDMLQFGKERFHVQFKTQPTTATSFPNNAKLPLRDKENCSNGSVKAPFWNAKEDGLLERLRKPLVLKRRKSIKVSVNQSLTNLAKKMLDSGSRQQTMRGSAQNGTSVNLQTDGSVEVCLKLSQADLNNLLANETTPASFRISPQNVQRPVNRSNDRGRFGNEIIWKRSKSDIDLAARISNDIEARLQALGAPKFGTFAAKIEAVRALLPYPVRQRINKIRIWRNKVVHELCSFPSQTMSKVTFMSMYITARDDLEKLEQQHKEWQRQKTKSCRPQSGKK